MRIEKYLSRAGITSRRKSKELINDGRVKINNKTAKTGSQAYINDKVTLNKRLISIEQKKIYLKHYR